LISYYGYLKIFDSLRVQYFMFESVFQHSYDIFFIVFW